MLNLNFGQKIFFFIVAVSALSVLMVAVPMFLNSANQLKSIAVNQARTQTAMISNMIGPAIEFDRNDMATTILNLLEESKDVELAAIYVMEGTPDSFLLFAHYGNEELSRVFHKPSHPDMEVMISSNYLETVSPIFSDGEVIGYLKIISSLNEIKKQIQTTTMYVGVAGGCSALIAIYLAFAARRNIIRPIAELNAVTREIADTKDYSRRAVRKSEDEVGDLIVSFNRMLDVIEDYDAARKAKENEIVQLNLGLEKKVEERTIELENSMSILERTVHDLKETQTKLVEQEKMASLGSLVAGVAHEINTPIGVAITASSHLNQSSRTMSEKFGSGVLTKSDFSGFVDELSEGTVMINKNLERAAELVKSFKMVAVDQSNEDVRDFNIKEYIESVLLSLKPKLKRTKHKVELDIPESLTVETSPGAISQIITNLIMNSLIHGFEGMEEGVITIRVQQDNGFVTLDYEDNGKGIPESMKETIFDPFVTSARHKGGSGLGTHILYNLVTQVLGGNVYLRDKQEPGVHFFIRFPDHYGNKPKLKTVGAS